MRAFLVAILAAVLFGSHANSHTPDLECSCWTQSGEDEIKWCRDRMKERGTHLPKTAQEYRWCLMYLVGNIEMDVRAIKEDLWGLQDYQDSVKHRLGEMRDALDRMQR